MNGLFRIVFQLTRVSISAIFDCSLPKLRLHLPLSSANSRRILRRFFRNVFLLRCIIGGFPIYTLPMFWWSLADSLRNCVSGFHFFPPTTSKVLPSKCVDVSAVFIIFLPLCRLRLPLSLTATKVCIGGDFN